MKEIESENNEDKLKEENLDYKKPPVNIFEFGRKRNPHILANPNRRVGKGMNATQQTIKPPHKKKKK